MTKIATLEDFFIHELTDVYGAEKQIVEALPDMIEAAQDAKLKAAFEAHFEQTETQVSRLEEAFSMLDMEAPARAHCAGMEGIITENAKLLKEDIDPSVLDAALICGAQKVEHYEIATYGTLAELAKKLDREDVADLLIETLEEEKETDEKLTAIAEKMVNEKALAA